MIDFKQFDLEGLYSLYESYLNLYNDYYTRLQSSDRSNDAEGIYLTSKIEYFILCIEEIKKEIPKKWDGTSTFSREYIFNITKVLKKPLMFFFRPNSNAYSKYGKMVIGYGIYDESTEQELLLNLIKNPPINTNGIVKIEIPLRESLTEDKVEKLASEGIETWEIFEVKGSVV